MTIEELAERLGVSKSTVSRALSGKGRIGRETRDKIISCAAEYGFAPRENVRPNLAKTRNIGVVIPSEAYVTNYPFFQDCLLGICEAATLQDYNVLIAARPGYDISCIRTLVEKKKVDGIILTRGLEEDQVVRYLTEIQFPVGMVGTCKNERVIQVDSDNRAASESLTSMLIERGYRHFAMILGNMSYRVNRERHRGCCDALEKRGLDPQHQMLCTDFGNMEFIDSIIEGIMAGKSDCIICGDDVICTKIMSRLQAEGYRIPMDIAVASLYNSSNLECFSPAVTTVNISAKGIGNAAGKQMLQYLTGKEYELKSVFDYEILFRKSTIKI